MSILFNNGSGGVNQTNGYIPYNDNGQFKDSPFYYNKIAQQIQSVNLTSLDDYGLFLDFTNQNFSLGDYNNNSKGVAIFVNDASEYIKTTTNGVNFGLGINQTNAYLGDFEYNKFGNWIQVDDTSQIIKTYLAGQLSGLSINYNGTTIDTYLGDFDGIYNNTYLTIFDSTQVIELRAATVIDNYANDYRVTTNNIKFSEITGGSLLYNTAGGSAGKHLKIFINGVGYKIALLNL